MKKLIVIAVVLFALLGCNTELKTIKGLVTNVEVQTVTHWLEGIKVITKVTFEDGRIKYFIDSLPDEIKKGQINIIHFKRYSNSSGSFRDKISGPVEFEKSH